MTECNRKRASRVRRVSSAPAFQFYPHDFLAGRVATYSLETVGAYILLLSFDWSLNGLPNSIEKLAKICRVSSRRFSNIWLEIADQFAECEDGRLRNPRLESERYKQLAYSQAMSENGKLGGRPPKPPKTRGLTAAKPTESSPSPSPNTTTSTLSLSDADCVLAHYIARHPRRRIGPKDRKAVANALTLGYAADELCAAIDGNADDAWHQEKRKHELPYVLRDTGKIDGFRERATDAIAKSAEPIVDAHGVLTAYGERMTRPTYV